MVTALYKHLQNDVEFVSKPMFDKLGIVIGVRALARGALRSFRFRGTCERIKPVVTLYSRDIL
jgi:hypothetical protein